MSDRILLATRKGVFIVTRQSNGSWIIGEPSFYGDNCSLVMHDPRDGAMYAALGHGHFGVKVHRSRDGGKTWSEIASPKYPPLPEGYEPKAPPFGGKPIPWNTELIWELRPGGDDQPGRIWCGTLPGGLFRSDDHGDSWHLVDSLWYRDEREAWFGGGADWPGIHSVCVDPRDSKHIRLGVSCGGVWHTRDDGETWFLHEGGMRAEFMPPERAMEPNAQDPHLIVQCRSNPDRCWVQHHNGIFRSDDGGMNWMEIEKAGPSTFGFAVAVDPNDGDTAWFVPSIKDEKRIPVDGRFVITRTRDGGMSFDVLSDGLPQQAAYDLVFRHALDVDASGQRLACGSTTGGFWISEDQGDRWTEVSSHLPPVYAVRFA